MSELSQGDKLSVSVLGQKLVYVGAAAPGTTYDGQVWVCTSSNPSLVKINDATNSGWLQQGETRYETVLSGQLPSSGVYLNGALCVAYDTEQSGTKLYAYANGSWRNMGGTITRVYPIGSVASFQTRAHGGGSIPVGAGVDLNSGITLLLCSTSITATNSGDVVCLFGGGTMGREWAGQEQRIRLFIGTTQVGSHLSDAAYHQFSMASTAMVPNTPINVYMDAIGVNSGSFYHTGFTMAAVSVKT